MAHIPDGVLSVPVLVGGGILAAGGIALGLRTLDDRDIPRTAILAAMFFVASLVAIPVGPTSIHPLLGGLMGLMLGVRAFHAVFIGLVLQAVLFGVGGITTLGVDTVTMALPGVVLASVCRPLLARADPRGAGLIAGGVAALSVAGTAAGVSLALALSSPDYLPGLGILAVSYLPLATIEAVITAVAVGHLARIRPDIVSFSRLTED